MCNTECPDFKLALNGDCLYYGEEEDEDTGCTIYFCKCDGEQLKFKKCCEMW